MQFYTPKEVSEILKTSTDTIMRKFSDYPGVIDIGTAESGHRRRYRTLRIPKEVLERFVVESRVA